MSDAPFTRNENYDGPDDSIARAQAEGDAWFREIARLRLSGGATLPAQDRLDLIELTNLWDSAYDALDFETWNSCFVADDDPDGPFVFASRGFGEYRGLQAMADYFHLYKQVFHGLRHVLSNHIIVGDGEGRARMFCYLTVVDRINSTAILGTSPFYDRVKKVDGRWKFVRRDQVVDPGMSTTPQVQEMNRQFQTLMGDK